MANNRVELATLPRHIDTIPGKTTADGLLISTDAIAFVFPTLTAANAAQNPAGVFTQRLDENTLALIANDLYRYMRGAAVDRSGDTWERLGAGSIDLTVAQTGPVDGTTLNTYTLNVDGVADTPTIPIATWAQDGLATNKIPMAKLPDAMYGDQHRFTSNANLMAGILAGTSTADMDLRWHQNDIGIVTVGGTSTVYLYVGTNQTAFGTVDIATDFVQLGNTLNLTDANTFITVVNNADKAATDANNNVTYNVSTNGSGEQVITFPSTFAFPDNFVLAVNGVSFIKTVDYTFDTAAKTVTFTSFLFTSTSTDTVTITGSNLG